MPRPFSEKEKERIRKLLIEKSKEFFSRYGIKKTGIGEITEAVGIAQGSFYLFFDSKEELYFRILEVEEQEIRDKFFNWLMDSGKITRAKFKEFLRLALNVFEENPLLRRLWFEGEIDDLLRRLPPELVERHAKKDASAFEPLIRQWQDEGSLIEAPPEIITGVIRSLFLLLLHSKEIGDDIYPEVMNMYINLIADGLVKENN